MRAHPEKLIADGPTQITWDSISAQAIKKCATAAMELRIPVGCIKQYVCIHNPQLFAFHGGVQLIAV